MSMTTVADLNDMAGLTLTTDWASDVEIPVMSGMQRQGDVLVRPAAVDPATPVPASGTPVVRGENGGNTHAVYADGPGVLCDTYPATGSDLTVATLLVPAGSQAFLGHPEHGYLGVAPGAYRIKRQREQADELRLIAD